MRSARSATSAWSRRRWPLMMPRKGDVDIVVVRSLAGFSRLLMVRSASSRVSNHEARGPSFETRLAPLLRMRSEHSSRVRKSWRALFEIGAHGFQLVGSAHQLHLLDGLG